MARSDSNSQLESDNINELLADKPLIKPQQDRLGYGPFAKHLADSVCRMNVLGGFVIAVYGPWGFGKSTLLNFFDYYLQQKPEDEQPIIVHFNPWLFSSDEDITKRFISQIQTSLSQVKALPEGFKARITNLLKAVSEIPVPYAEAGKALVKLFDHQQRDTSELKAELEDKLAERHPRIVVTIDDIDKLAAEDIKQLFHLLGGIPNFNNVVYLLLFDRQVVINKLGDTEGIPGEVYLQKVVQVPFELPIPDKTSLRRLLFEKLSAIFADIPKQLFEQSYWGNVYYQGIDYFITNPCDITYLTNILTVTYAATKGEVNPIDFIAIETLRVFQPMIYNIIWKNPQFFAGHLASQSPLVATIDEFKRFHYSWLAQLKEPEKEAVRQIVIHLFPKLNTVWHNTYYSAEHESTWCKQLRLCSLEVFPNYFRLALAKSESSKTKMTSILALGKDASAFAENLLELASQKRSDGTTEVRAFLEQMEEYTQRAIAINYIPSIVQAFFDVGDRLLQTEDEAYGIFDFGNDIRIGRIISQLLRRLMEPARFEILKEAMFKGSALSIIVGQVVTWSQEQGADRADELNPIESEILSEEHLKEIETISLNRLRGASQQNSLLQTPKLPEILSYWQSRAKEEVEQWIEKIFETDEGLVNLLEKFQRKDLSKQGSNGMDNISYELDPQWLEPYLETSLIVNRVRSLKQSSGLTPAKKTALSHFVEAYDLRQQETQQDKLIKESASE
jgi:predicted KAP-like P-loop ATPase